ncbi:MAG: ABC transporter permease, partial [Cellulomonas sp.]|nr:ABC transporter permease [Cellulomonas sp.]
MPPETRSENIETTTDDSAPDSAAGTHADFRSLESGLDALQTSPLVEKGPWRRFADGILPPVVLLLALIAAWQFYIVIAKPRPDPTPGRLDVLTSITDLWSTGHLQTAVVTSLSRGGIGLLIAVAIGTPLGLPLPEWRLHRRALGP